MALPGLEWHFLPWNGSFQFRMALLGLEWFFPPWNGPSQLGIILPSLEWMCLPCHNSMGWHGPAQHGPIPIWFSMPTVASGSMVQPGMDAEEWAGPIWHGTILPSMGVTAWNGGMDWHGMAWSCMAWPPQQGEMWSGTATNARNGIVLRGVVWSSRDTIAWDGVG